MPVRTCRTCTMAAWQLPAPVVPGLAFGQDGSCEVHLLLHGQAAGGCCSFTLAMPGLLAAACRCRCPCKGRISLLRSLSWCQGVCVHQGASKCKACQISGYLLCGAFGFWHLLKQGQDVQILTTAHLYTLFQLDGGICAWVATLLLHAHHDQEVPMAIISCQIGCQVATAIQLDLDCMRT